ncbi:MAG: class I SAM-dependent methyltransferase [Thermodesulfovibrionia bacterium]
MKREEYHIMYSLEDTYWWYIGLRRLVSHFINQLNYKRKDLSILDAGCGTGGMLTYCKDYNSYGLDLSEDSIRFCKLRKLNNIIRGSVCDLPFKDNSFDIVISLDVLCHRWVDDDLETLRRFYEIMKKDGLLVLNLPAYNFLISKHDKAVYAKRRYTLKVLKERVEGAGFEVQRITYRNSILFPFALTKRIIERIFIEKETDVTSDLKPLPNPLNRLLTGIIYVENLLIKSGINLPFGLSVFCVARKR